MTSSLPCKKQTGTAGILRDLKIIHRKEFLANAIISGQTTIFVILSAAKNLSFKAAVIHHSARLRSE